MYKLLKVYFLKCILNIMVKMGINLVGWGDYLFEYIICMVLLWEFFLNKEVYLFVWSIIGVLRNNYEVFLMVNYGYKVIVFNGFFNCIFVKF